MFLVHEAGLTSQIRPSFSLSVHLSKSIERRLKMSELAEAFRNFTLNTNNQQVFGCSFIF